MEAYENDITENELDRIATRVSRLLRKAGIMPLHSLQYYLSEVGQNRIDPRKLSRVLKELSNNRRPRKGRAQPGPWEPVRGIYASNRFTSIEAHQLATPTVRTIR